MTTIRMLKTGPLKSDFHPKLYVGNLPWTVGDAELSHYFSKFGELSEAKVQFHPTTFISQSYAYVKFTHRESYRNALNAQFHWLEGRLLKIEPANHRFGSII